MQHNMPSHLAPVRGMYVSKPKTNVVEGKERARWRDVVQRAIWHVNDDRPGTVLLTLWQREMLF